MKGKITCTCHVQVHLEVANINLLSVVATKSHALVTLTHSVLHLFVFIKRV